MKGGDHRSLLGCVSIPVCLLVWEALSRLGLLNPLFAPAPSAVLRSLGEAALSGRLYLDARQSFLNYAIGVSAALLAGIPAGLATGYYPRLGRFFHPIIELLRPIPPIAWIPIAIMIFKLTPQAAGFLIFIGAVFPILLNTSHGVRYMEKVYLEAALSLGARSEWFIIRRVIIPAALPSILAGVRISLGVGWMCVVAAEMFGVSNHGLGYAIMLARWNHQPDMLIAYMLAIGLVGLGLDRGFGVIERRWTAWKLREGEGSG